MNVPLQALRNGVELKHLRYALVAAELRSFARAAAYFGTKQATLSQHVSYLERRFGTELFSRSTRGVTPTKAGAVFLASARRVLDEMDGLQVKTRAVGLGGAGSMSFGFLTSVTAGNLRASLIAFDSEYPEIQMRGVEDERPSLLSKLETGALDLLILGGAVPYDHTHRMSLWSERMLIALPGDHPLAERDQVFWLELQDETFLAPKTTAQDITALVQFHLARPGITPSIIATEVSRETVLSAVSAGRGITVVSAGSSGLRIENVVYRELYDAAGPYSLDFSAYWRADNHNPALGTFLEFLRARYSLVLPAS